MAGQDLLDSAFLFHMGGGTDAREDFTFMHRFTWKSSQMLLKDSLPSKQWFFPCQNGRGGGGVEGGSYL